MNGLTKEQWNALLPEGDREPKSLSHFPLRKSKDQIIEQLEYERSNAILAIEAQALANEEAALRSPEWADWSNGVAEGLRIALNLLGATEKGETGQNA